MNTKTSLIIMVFVVLAMCMLYSPVSKMRLNAGVSTTDTANSSKRTKCILYDKPPRTGSTTIGRVLNSCLKKAGYDQRPFPEKNRAKKKAYAIQHMLNPNIESNRRASLSRHVYLTEKDLKQVHSRCNDLFYISSTAPMRERLWSAVKHLLARGHESSPNYSLDMKVAQELLRNQSFAKGELRSLYELNAYPYLTEDANEAKIKKKLIPDYVIRRQYLEQDLKPLLHAFGCENSFKARNVHEDNIENLDDIFSNVPFSDRDELYKSLCHIAELKNNETLKIAKSFLL